MKTQKKSGDFNSFAERYEYFVTNFLGSPWLGWDDLSGERAIDVGCGAGQTTRVIATKFQQVVGIDISDELIALAKRKHHEDNIDYHVMDLREYSPAEKFDFVYSHTVMHHLEDYESGLRRIKSFVKNGGKILIIDNVSDRYRTPPRWAYTMPAKIGFIPNIFKLGMKKALFLLGFWHDINWLAHLASDAYLTREEFRAVYTRVFPGCEISDLGFANAMKWIHAERGCVDAIVE